MYFILEGASNFTLFQEDFQFWSKIFLEIITTKTRIKQYSQHLQYSQWVGLPLIVESI